MRVSSYAVARPNYYDRNPASVQSVYQADIAPNGNTERFTRTIAAGKSGYIESLYCGAYRSSAAAVLGTVVAFIETVTSDATPAYKSYIIYSSATLNSQTFQSATSVGLLQAGDIIRGYQFDTSTGGTNSFFMNCKLTLFDK